MYAYLFENPVVVNASIFKVACNYDIHLSEINWKKINVGWGLDLMHCCYWMDGGTSECQPAVYCKNEKGLWVMTFWLQITSSKKKHR